MSLLSLIDDFACEIEVTSAEVDARARKDDRVAVLRQISGRAL